MVQKLFSTILMVTFVFALLPSQPAFAWDPYCLVPDYYLAGADGTSRASNGDTVTWSGTSYIIVKPSYVIPYSYSTSFVHRDSNGNILHSGTWEATKLQFLREYGCNTYELYLFGGYVVLKVKLHASDGNVYNGTLEFESPEGEPPYGSTVRMRLTVKDWGLTFDQPIDVGTYLTIF